MDLKNNIPNIELRSEEVQELMGRIPPIILRVGISVILFFIFIIYIASNFIKYPDIISIPIVAKNVNYMKEIKTVNSGQLAELNIEHSYVHKGDILAKIVAYNVNVIDTVYVKSPFAGVVYPCNAFQKGDYVEKNDILCVLVDAINDSIIAKASVPFDLKKKIEPGMSIESNVNSIMLQGRITSIATYANPTNGTYTTTMIFKSSKELENIIVWNYHTNANIKTNERSVFERFFKNRIIPIF